LSEPNTLKESGKVTPSKLPLTYTFDGVTFPDSFKVFGSDNSKVIFCEADDWKPFYESTAPSSIIACSRINAPGSIRAFVFVKSLSGIAELRNNQYWCCSW
jgi:hypothetical protein